jgi:RNA recognition motif-containing protein
MNIYVSNLSFNIHDDDLRDLFSTYGEVTSAKIISDRETGKSRGFAFVEMPEDSAARKAISELNGGSYDGRDLRVSEARPKESKPVRRNNPFKY